MKDTIPFETMRKLLGKALTNNLEPLSDSSDLISEHIMEFLLFALPIAKHKNTRPVVAHSENLLFLISTKFIFL
ncbi:1027_t:CDS:2 [Gigaspora margarita]|uniref:1027_t:CDS:1 n=1 Tax=Gigaspora margarita TaxID=4874 RepID=A0ABN7UJA7_GIGMA|nr:1027_t:CDS:2 [Gigaspora margarita]